MQMKICVACCGELKFTLILVNEDSLSSINLLKTKPILFYIRNQSVPRSKHFPPRL